MYEWSRTAYLFLPFNLFFYLHNYDVEIGCRCVRNINETHNYLYCEYVTGMMTYFDLR